MLYREIVNDKTRNDFFFVTSINKVLNLLSKLYIVRGENWY